MTTSLLVLLGVPLKGVGRSAGRLMTRPQLRERFPLGSTSALCLCSRGPLYSLCRPPAWGPRWPMGGSKATLAQERGVSRTSPEPRAGVTEWPHDRHEVLLRWLFLASGGGGCLHSRMVPSFQTTRTTLGTHVHEDDTVFPLLSLQRE